jgi:hypothetical protein
MKAVKEKITITLDRKRAAKLRRVSRLRRTTIDALVSEMTDQLDTRSPAETEQWLESLGTTLVGKITKKDMDADPKLAKYMARPAGK